MERELWPILYRTIRKVAAGFSQKYVQIPGWVLLATMVWAAIHDRPVSWACQESNWANTRMRPQRLPSNATMSRRVDRVSVGLLWRAVEQCLREMPGIPPSLIAVLDGKPLPVSGVSKDPDARVGRGAGMTAKGYKLHTVWADRPIPETWEVTSLNVSEKVVARRLIPQLTAGGYLLTDGNYDANYLFDDAAEHGYQQVAPLPRGSPGGGHHYQSPHRMHSITIMQKKLGEELLGLREKIERAYGSASSFGGGLAPLPAWVRGLQRVRTWVWAKLMINAARIIKHKDLRQD